MHYHNSIHHICGQKKYLYLVSSLTISVLLHNCVGMWSIAPTAVVSKYHGSCMSHFPKFILGHPVLSCVQN